MSNEKLIMNYDHQIPIRVFPPDHSGANGGRERDRLRIEDHQPFGNRESTDHRAPEVGYDDVSRLFEVGYEPMKDDATPIASRETRAVRKTQPKRARMKLL